MSTRRFVQALTSVGARQIQLPRPCQSCPRSPSKTDIADTFLTTINPLTLSERIASRAWRVSSALGSAVALLKALAQAVPPTLRRATSIRTTSHRSSVREVLLAALLPPVV